VPRALEALTLCTALANAFKSASRDVDRRATRAIVRLGLGLANRGATRLGLAVIPLRTAISGTNPMPSPDSTICTRAGFALMMVLDTTLGRSFVTKESQP
jgi:hypothetical protein